MQRLLEARDQSQIYKIVFKDSTEAEEKFNRLLGLNKRNKLVLTVKNNLSSELCSPDTEGNCYSKQMPHFTVKASLLKHAPEANESNYLTWNVR